MELLAGLPAGGPPAASWSTVSSPALVLGRAASRPPLNPAAVSADDIEVLTRSSGGGPVLWDAGLLALDVVLPRGHRLVPDDVVEGYRWLGEALAGALSDLGVPGVEVVGVERARAARPGAAADACFGALSPYEVTAGGRKVVGLSQARRRTGALVQAGILLSLDAARLARLLGRGAAFAADLRRRAAGLRELSPGLGAEEVVAAADARLADHAGAALGGGTA